MMCWTRATNFSKCNAVFLSLTGRSQTGNTHAHPVGDNDIVIGRGGLVTRSCWSLYAVAASKRKRIKCIEKKTKKQKQKQTNKQNNNKTAAAATTTTPTARTPTTTPTTITTVTNKEN